MQGFAIYCNTKRCHTSATFVADSPKQARTYARKWGWRYDKKRGKDYCPDHSPTSGTQTQIARS